jgi:hypothetical protein
VAQGFSKCPVQDLFLMLPTISRWQWHPFSIMGRRDNGDGHTSTLTVAMKKSGIWTEVRCTAWLALQQWIFEHERCCI